MCKRQVSVFVVACFILAGTCNALRPTLLHEGQSRHKHQQHRSLMQVPIGGVGGGAAAIGPVVGAVAQGVNVGLDIVAPMVNAVASNIPVMLPSFNGLCMNGQPIVPFKERPGMVLCLVGNGAQVTNFLFDATARLTGVAGSMAGGGGFGK